MSLQDSTEMRFCVSVPVLSEHRTSMAPKFWMAVTSLTMTFFFDMSMEPLARLAETMVASISGIRPMASVRAKITGSRTQSWKNCPQSSNP